MIQWLLVTVFLFVLQQIPKLTAGQFPAKLQKLVYSNVDVDILGKQSNITTASLSVKFYQVDVATEKAKGVTLRMGFYDATGDIISDSVVMTFDSASNDSQQREQKHTFRFKNMISKLNGQEVTLRMERQIENTDQYAPYKVETYKVKVMFEAEW